MRRVILPELGEGIEKAIISYWYAHEGQTVKEKDELVELTTDKATFNLPAPCTGIITEIFYQDGESVDVGETLAIIEEEDDVEEDFDSDEEEPAAEDEE
jgi:pyruvate/2-oxoglutarate dehydrogenase complex dihydrolipoamide acyltransferase (E2) component